MKRINFLFFSAIAFCLASCSKDLPSPGGTATEALANEWWVNFYAEGDAPSTAFTKIMTSNTSANNNQIWVNDLGHLWDFNVKANADLSNLTFKADTAVSIVEGYDIKVNIIDGKVLPGKGHSKSGNIVDSIYMEVQFEDDTPAYGTTYIVTGHARTGFFEDEY